MSWNISLNPGIGGLEELTSAEEVFLTTFAGLELVEGSVLRVESGALAFFAQPKITVGTVAPSTPSTGDLWVDTN